MNFEFVAQSGYIFSAALYNPAASYALIESGISLSEVRTTVYRGDSVIDTGIVYMIATAGALRVTGYINLDVPHPNGFCEVFSTYDEALNVGKLSSVQTTVNSLLTTVNGLEDTIQGSINLLRPISQLIPTTGYFDIGIGVDFDERFNIVVPADWVKIIFTVKKEPNVDTDNDAYIQVSATSTPSIPTGLIRLNKAAAVNSGDASLTPDVAQSQIRLVILARATSELPKNMKCFYDFKIFRPANAIPFVTRPAEVKFLNLVTRALS